MKNETIFFTSVEISEDEYNKLREFAKKQGRITAESDQDSFLVSETTSCANVSCVKVGDVFKLAILI